MVAILTLFLSACGVDKEADSSVKGDTNWPEKNIELIVPFSEGGSVDALARGLGSNWEEELDTQIIIENKSGASGLLGASLFLEKESDGHTMFVGLQPTLSMNTVVQDANFSLDDFKFINIEQQDYGTIAVHKDSPYKTIDDLIEDVKNRPGEVTMSVAAGAGTSLFGYAFVDALDLDVNVVTFDSGGEQRTDTLGGHSDFAASGAFGDLAIKDEIRVLTVASEEKFPGFDAPPINKVLSKYTDKTLPAIGDSRFIAVHKEFAEENPKVFEEIVESYKNNYESEKYQDFVKSRDADIITTYYGPEKSLEVMEEIAELVENYSDLLKGQQ